MIKKTDRLQGIFSPVFRFWSLILLLIPFSLQNNPWLKLGETALLAFLVDRSGKRLKWSYFGIMVGSITFFHILTPAGELLFSLGPLDVTRGALALGFTKGLTIIGMVFLSLAAVHPSLRIPGALGALMTETFQYLDLILERKGELTRGNWIEKVDTFLEDIYPLKDYDNTRGVLKNPSSHNPLRWVLAGGLWTLFWGLWLLQGIL